MNKTENQWTVEEVTKAQQLRQEGKTWPEISKALGRSEVSVRVKLKRVGEITNPALCPDEVVENGSKISEDYQKDKATIESRSTRITTVDQLVKASNVDLSVWEVERHIINKWEVGRKDKTVNLTWEKGVSTGSVNDSGKIFVEPLIQVKIWLVRKSSKKSQVEVITDSLDKLTDRLLMLPPVAPIVYPPNHDGHLLEIAIPDLHFGKLCWARETGESNYDTRIARKSFEDALKTLLHYASPFPIEKILMPIGNDFFNVDNDARETTAGTVQDEDCRWQKSFIGGELLTVEAIRSLREIAPVQVVLVPGNHDFQRVFYLGRVLRAVFANTPGVTIDDSPESRKFVLYGRNLLGFTHGNEEALSILPNLMAQRVPELWAKSSFREWHLGHVHHKKDKIFAPLAEQNGVRMRYIASLSPADSWHAKKGYIALRAAEAFLWHPTAGCKANFSFHPETIN